MTDAGIKSKKRIEGSFINSEFQRLKLDTDRALYLSQIVLPMLAKMPFLAVTRVAEQVGLSVDTVVRTAQEKDIPLFQTKRGGSKVMSVSDISRLLEQC